MISGTADRPRVAVFKSNRHLVAQVIDDEARCTLAAASDASVKASPSAAPELGAKAAKAYALGAVLAEKMKALKISRALFDRGGFAYHGRVKAVADGLRAGGINL